MSRKLKRLGVGLVAVLALSLAITSIAAAAKFTAASYPAFFEGEAERGAGYVTTEAGKGECGGSSSATLNEASSTLTISNFTPTECQAFGFSATVSTNECSFLVHIGSGSGDTYTGSGDLLCPTGKAIVTNAGACVTEVFPQSGGVTIEYTNNTAEGKVEAEVTFSSINYNVKDGFLCPFNGSGERTGGTFTQLEPAIVSIEGNEVDIG
jgi:hypothetical protein